MKEGSVGVFQLTGQRNDCAGVTARGDPRERETKKNTGKKGKGPGLTYGVEAWRH